MRYTNARYPDKINDLISEDGSLNIEERDGKWYIKVPVEPGEFEHKLTMKMIDHQLKVWVDDDTPTNFDPSQYMLKYFATEKYIVWSKGEGSPEPGVYQINDNWMLVDEKDNRTSMYLNDANRFCYDGTEEEVLVPNNVLGVSDYEIFQSEEELTVTISWNY